MSILFKYYLRPQNKESGAIKDRMYAEESIKTPWRYRENMMA